MEVLNFIKHVIATVFTLIFLPVSTVIPPVESYEAQNAEELKTSFTVLSDIHIEGNNFQTFKEFSEILKEVKNSEDNDTLVFLGDNTMNGQVVETMFVYSLVSRFLGTEDIIVAPGNHDMDTSKNTNGDFDDLSKRFVSMRNSFFGDDGDKVYFSREKNGYKFIVLGGEGRTGEDGKQILSDAQLDWLESELSEAKNSGKPCFIINHYLVYGRNGSRSYAGFNVTDQNDRLTEILETSGVRTFYFCGHSHYGVSDDSVQTTSNVTYINLPATGNPGNYYPANEVCGKDGIGVHMEVYEDQVVLRFRNYITGQWLDGYDNYVFGLD